MNPFTMILRPIFSVATLVRKNTTYKGVIYSLVLIPCFLFMLPSTTYADTNIRQQGVNITPSSPTSFSSPDFLQSLKDLKATHANAVNFVIRFSQSSVTSTDMGPTNNTPTDASLVQAIKEAHSLGLTVTIKPHLDPNDGQWRAFIDPADRAQWFRNYDNYILHYAKIAQDNSVEQLVIGTELIDMTSATHNSSNTNYWNGIISDIRKVYSGKLGYAANWGPTGTVLDEKNQIGFWSKLDFAGLDAYYPLTAATDNSVAALESAWSGNAADVTAFANSVGKPLVFTEVGYQSTNNAHLAPGEWQAQNGVNDTEQANAYQAFFSFWNSVSYLKGIYLWEWQPESAAGGSSDQDYTPQNKPAEAILSSWFGGTGVATPYIPALALATTHSFNASTTVSNTTLTLGASQVLSTAVSNKGNGAENSILIDTEIYSSNGTKVFQKFTDGETFTQGQTSVYQNTWMPTAAGVYTVKTGVFTSNWGTNYSWNDTAATFTVLPVDQVYIQVPTITASSTADAVAPQTQSTITVTIKNNSNPLPSALVDVEVYDANGTRVFQQFKDNQSFAAVDTKQLQFAFTPTNVGTYRIAVGVFTADWSKNYLWIGQSGTIQVSATPITPVVTPVIPPTIPTPVLPIVPVATTTPISIPVATTTPVVIPIATTTPVVTPVIPPVLPTLPISPTTTPATTTPVVITPVVPPTVPVISPSQSISVWWPTTGSNIGGVTPFKAVVDSASVADYSMYWQVDGGQLNRMYDSSQDYPHKESMVDVSGWNWQGTGLYTLTFTAKNSAGTVLATKNITVTINH